MHKQQMTSKERVLAAFRGEATDRYPLVNPVSLANVECMQLSKSFFPYAHFDSLKMASLSATGHDILKFDTIAPYFGVCNEAAAFGCTIDWGGIDSIPIVKIGVMETLDRYSEPVNFLDHKYVKTILNAIKIVKQKYENNVAIIGKVVGPLSLLFQIYGLQNTLTSLILEPETVKQVVYAMKDICIKFARAQMEAGADIITLSDDGCADHISSNGYRFFAMEANNAIQHALAGSTYTVFHLSSVITEKLPFILQGGFDAISFDARNSIEDIAKLTNGSIKLIGCINNPMTLLNGTPSEVIAAVYHCIESGINMIAPECAIPCRISNENLLAIYKAVNQYTPRQKKKPL